MRSRPVPQILLLTMALHGATAALAPARDITTIPLASAGLARTFAFVNGSVYIPTGLNGTVTRVDAKTRKVTATYKVGNPEAGWRRHDPTAVANVAGQVWVSLYSQSALGLLDPTSGKITRTVKLPAPAYGLTADGSTVWTVHFEEDAVMQVDVNTGKILRNIKVHKPITVAVGEGAAWIVKHRDNEVARVDPGSSQVNATIPLSLSDAFASWATVAHGSVWATSLGDRALYRIDPKTNKVVARIETGGSTFGVAAHGQNVWVATRNLADPASGALLRVDPARNEVVEEVPVAGPTGLAAHDGALWVGYSPDGPTPALYHVSLP